MRIRQGAAFIGLTAAAVLMTAPVAGASKSGPCSGSATVDGVTYDHTYDTPDRAIVIPAEKSGVSVTWEGSTGTAITDHRGSVSILIGPFPVVISDWEGENADSETMADGTYDLSALPSFVASATGLYEVSAEHAGTGGSCEGRVMVELEGNAIATPLGAGAVAGTVLTAAGLVLAGRGRVT